MERGHPDRPRRSFSELYHVLNRGVDKRTIFLDNQDRLRFIHDLSEFNDTRSAQNTTRLLNDLRGRTRGSEQLVDIHGWCLMENHYHLLISERMDGGLSKFLMKLNVGYAKYFNEKYVRVGTLFQGRTKKIHVDTDAHFLHILHYVHLNPLDFLKGAQDWRTRIITRAERALIHLESYRWSSFQDYCGKSNFPSIITKDLFIDIFPNYRRVISKYLRDMEYAKINTDEWE